jgi:hypothetical protein
LSSITRASRLHDRQSGARAGLPRHAGHAAHPIRAPSSRIRPPPGGAVGRTGTLAAYPSGCFAPEARYNRALVLVRLGRRAEAREALRPFAAGELGGYRQREAKELIDAME